MRTILIGCGDHGSGTLLPAAWTAGVHVCAVADTDPERAARAAEHWQIPQVYSSIDQIDPGTFDAALIALPVAEQFSAATWALRQGLNVFVEKPPAPDLAGIHTLARLAREAGTICAVGMNFRWAEGVQRMREVLAEGRFGEVRMVRVEHLARKPVTPFSPQLSLEASLFAAQGIHAIDLAQQLLPSKFNYHGQMVEVSRGRLCTLVGEDRGTRLEVEFGSCVAGFTHRLTAVTDRGDKLRLDNLRELVHLPSGADGHTDHYPGERTMWRTSPVAGGYAAAGYGPELAAFARMVHGDSAEGLALVDDVVAAYEAYDAVLTSGGHSWTA